MKAKPQRKVPYRSMIILAGLTVLLMSLPFLVPGCGVLALIGLVPLLAMERIADEAGVRHFWIWHYTTFLAWNAVTTWWVAEASLGGCIFAMTANALQMSLVFGLFRAVKRRIGRGVPAYLFLAAAWIAWERYYLVWAEISWPWLVLGNAFAGDPALVQWYEWTGTLGGSLWVWASNLSLFALMLSLLGGRWRKLLPKARIAAVTALMLLYAGPVALSLSRWYGFDDEADVDGQLPFLIVQPNIDPYAKFQAATQASYDNQLIAEVDRYLADGHAAGGTLLVVAPETFTYGMIGSWLMKHPSHQRYLESLRCHPETAINLLYGASTHDLFEGGEAPSHTARRDGTTWFEDHNSALIADASGRIEIYHKSKLVVGVESTPYPAFFAPLDEWLLGGVMGRDIGQDKRTPLSVVTAEGRRIPIGCAICYESVYGEFCTEYVRDAGARLLTVITNDGWWGDTPGYMQHLRYSSLRAIETRREVVRCGNTGISAHIDRRGRILATTPWWQPASLSGIARLSSSQTFFVRNGDLVGRLSVLVFLLMLGLYLVRLFIPKEFDK